MAFAVSGFKAIAQNYVSPNIASNFYPRIKFLSALGAFTLTRNGKTNLNIGRPDVGTLFTGKALGQAEMMDLVNFNSYQPRIQSFETSNSKWMGSRDTNPTVSSPTTNAQSQAGQNAALFNRCRLKTPIMIWHEDLKRAGRAGTVKGRTLGAAKLIEEATEIGFQEHVKEINAQIAAGTPTNQASDPWDKPLGVQSALSGTNVYGNVDRSVTANAAWKAQVDAAFTNPDIYAIVQDMNVTKNLNDLTKRGAGVDLVMTNKTLYLQFKNQVQAQSGHVVRVLAEGIPGMAAMGVKQECIQVDNAYVMYDEILCGANTVMGFVMDTWRFAAPPSGLCAVSDFKDLSEYTEGGKEADQAYVESEFIFSCDNPFLNVRYTAIGT